MTKPLDSLKLKIIDLVTHTEDQEKLDEVYNRLSRKGKRSAQELREELIASGGVKLGPAPPLEQLVREQNRQKVSYEELIASVEGLWDDTDISLQDLLNAVD